MGNSSKNGMEPKRFAWWGYIRMCTHTHTHSLSLSHKCTQTEHWLHLCSEPPFRGPGTSCVAVEGCLLTWDEPPHWECPVTANRKWQWWARGAHTVLSQRYWTEGLSYLQWCSLFCLAQPQCRCSPRSWSPSGAHKCRPPGKCSPCTCQSTSLQLQEERKSMWASCREKLS